MVWLQSCFAPESNTLLNQTSLKKRIRSKIKGQWVLIIIFVPSCYGKYFCCGVAWKWLFLCLPPFWGRHTFTDMLGDLNLHKWHGALLQQACSQHIRLENPKCAKLISKFESPSWKHWLGDLVLGCSSDHLPDHTHQASLRSLMVFFQFNFIHVHSLTEPTKKNRRNALDLCWLCSYMLKLFDINKSIWMQKCCSAQIRNTE